jgi:hypothetical protein
MKKEDKYLLGCLYAINRLQEKGSTEYAVNVDGKWETVPWKEICEWIEKKYAIKREVQ